MQPLLFHRLWHIGELVDAVLELLSLRDLLILAHTCTHARDFARHRILRRTKMFMQKCIPSDYLAPFFEKLHCTSAAIAGSVSSMTLMNNWIFSAADLPTDINIITPRGTLPEWDAFIMQVLHGYVPITSDSAPFRPRHADAVRTMRLYHLWFKWGTVHSYHHTSAALTDCIDNRAQSPSPRVARNLCSRHC